MKLGEFYHLEGKQVHMMLIGGTYDKRSSHSPKYTITKLI